MEAEFFVGPPPPDKEDQLKKAVQKAAEEKVSADRPEVVVDFSEPPAPKGKPSGMKPPEGIEAVLSAMRAQREPEKKSSIILPGSVEAQNEPLQVEQEIMDPDDPTFLLEQELGLMFGQSRAAKMAKGARAGMHNLTQQARNAYLSDERKAKLADRAERRAKRSKGKKRR